MTKEKIELIIRTAFNWHGRCEDYTEEQVADFYENMNLLDDRGVREILPLLMICELHNYGIKNAFRDMLIYFLDGAYLKRNANGGWWCNEDAHRNGIEFSKAMFCDFTDEQKKAVAKWLLCYARESFRPMCTDDVESACMFWESGCNPDQFDFPGFRRCVQHGVGYGLMPL